ncbi:MAG TPA: autotransporter domain-containing protein [Ensifer sp.]|nr:autotransporter domain-containing protein [Ensifer sp.]
MNKHFLLHSVALGVLVVVGHNDVALAACFTSGTCTNNGTLSGSGAHTIDSSAALDLTNNGSIIGPAGWSAIAASGGLNVTNFNSITGGNTGIFITGSSATITNKSSGSISGSAFFGVHATNGASSVTIVNDGTISGKSGILSQVTSSATVTNRGTISSTAAWSAGQTYAGYGINFDSGHATLNNYGTISGMTSAVMIGAGGNTFNIYDGSVFTNGIDYNNKTGNTTNFYTGSYTLGVKNYQLNTNTINLRGTAQTLITSGLVNGNGDIVVVDNSAPLSANSAGPIVASYTSSVISDLLSNDVIVQDIGIGDVFPRDSVNEQSQSSAKAGFYPDRMKLRTSKAQAAFANVLTSSAAANATGALLIGSGQTVDRYGNLVWSRSFGGAYFQDPFGSMSGQRTYSGGTMVGYDWNDTTWRVGGFFGLGRMRTNRSLSADHVTTDTVFGGLYGRYRFDKFNLDATLSGGSINATTQRYINNGTEVATGKVNGYFLSPEVALGYNMNIADGWVFTPTGRLRYVGAFSDPYTETGSSQNVSYGRSVSQSFEEHLELRLTHNVKDDRGLTSSYYVQAAAIAAQRVGPDGFAANLAGTSFTVGAGGARAKAGGSLSVGMNYKVTQQFDLFGSVEAAAFSDKSYSFAARGGIKVSF